MRRARDWSAAAQGVPSRNSSTTGTSARTGAAAAPSVAPRASRAMTDVGARPLDDARMRLDRARVAAVGDEHAVRQRHEPEQRTLAVGGRHRVDAVNDQSCGAEHAKRRARSGQRPFVGGGAGASARRARFEGFGRGVDGQRLVPRRIAVLFETARAPVERGLFDLGGKLEQRGADDPQVAVRVVDVTGLPPSRRAATACSVRSGEKRFAPSGERNPRSSPMSPMPCPLVGSSWSMSSGWTFAQSRKRRISVSSSIVRANRRIVASPASTSSATHAPHRRGSKRSRRQLSRSSRWAICDADASARRAGRPAARPRAPSGRSPRPEAPGRAPWAWAIRGGTARAAPREAAARARPAV